MPDLPILRVLLILTEEQYDSITVCMCVSNSGTSLGVPQLMKFKKEKPEMKKDSIRDYNGCTTDPKDLDRRRQV